MRFYVSPEYIFPEKNTIELRDKKEVHHIRDVMRLKRGIAVIVFDGTGKEYIGDIKEIDRNAVVIAIKESVVAKGYNSLNVTLYQAIPKKGKLDFIIEKATELGVDFIVPIITERTVSVVKDIERRERWLSIAKAASKQCGRTKLPLISGATIFNNALIESKKSDLVLFAALDKDAKPLSSILKDIKPKTVSVFVGPEGDFSVTEISILKKEGCRICSLGPLVLRVETAAIYILSCLNYEYR